MTDEAFPDSEDVPANLARQCSLLEALFPTPWTVETHTQSFIIRDARSKPVSYVYFEDSNRQIQRYSLSREDAWHIATSIARLPDFMKRADCVTRPDLRRHDALHGHDGHTFDLPTTRPAL